MTAATTAPIPSSPDAVPAVRLDRTPRRIRARLGDATIADSIDARLGYAPGHHPEYFVPVGDTETSAYDIDPSIEHDGFGSSHPLRRHTDGAPLGRHYVEGPASGLVHLRFDAVDAWFEEDEQIWFHPRDPYRRVDVLESSRHLVVAVDGVVIADTRRPRLVVETGLPERWYVPRADVDWSRLESSDTTSACQYKGIANWWHVRDVHRERLVDLVWGYERPIAEAPKLAGLVAFYAEHPAVETRVDGVTQARPEFDPSWLSPSLHITDERAAA